MLKLECLTEGSLFFYDLSCYPPVEKVSWRLWKVQIQDGDYKITVGCEQSLFSSKTHVVVRAWLLEWLYGGRCHEPVVALWDSRHRQSPLTPSVTLVWLLVLCSSPRVYGEKEHCSQSKRSVSLMIQCTRDMTWSFPDKLDWKNSGMKRVKQVKRRVR